MPENTKDMNLGEVGSGWKTGRDECKCTTGKLQPKNYSKKSTGTG